MVAASPTSQTEAPLHVCVPKGERATTANYLHGIAPPGLGTTVPQTENASITIRIDSSFVPANAAGWEHDARHPGLTYVISYVKVRLNEGYVNVTYLRPKRESSQLSSPPRWTVHA